MGSARNSQQLASYVLHQAIEIAAPLDVVWDLQLHVNEWPTWQPGIESAWIDDVFRVGAQFCWSCGNSTTTATVDTLSGHRRVVWHAADDGAFGVHEWTFEPSLNGTRVTATEFLEEVPGRAGAKPEHADDDEFLALWLDNLKAEAEART